MSKEDLDEGKRRQSESGKAHVGNLKPFQKGQTGNPTGKNGAKWLAEFRAFFDDKEPGSPNSRFYNVCYALYVRALKGSDFAQRTILEHMKGKPTETVNISDDSKPRVLVLLPKKGQVMEAPPEDDDDEHIVEGGDPAAAAAYVAVTMCDEVEGQKPADQQEAQAVPGDVTT